MFKLKKYSFLILITLFFLGCNKLKTPEAIAERDNWYESFEDSIKFYDNKTKEIYSQLNELNERISRMLNDFEKVKKPREVTGYYILKGWSSKVPLKSTGIYARINENETLELIATLAGATFNQIAVGNVTSEIVKHDQALNYRHESYNTVFFTGGKADTIALYIANHSDHIIKLEFLEGGKRRSQISLPENEKEIIIKSWNLLSCQMEARKLQKELAICARKIETFRRLHDDHLESKK